MYLVDVRKEVALSEKANRRISNLKGLSKSSPKLASIETFPPIETVGYSGFAVGLIEICFPVDFVILY
jgi:hypothetical protein